MGARVAAIVAASSIALAATVAAAQPAQPAPPSPAPPAPAPTPPPGLVPTYPPGVKPGAAPAPAAPAAPPSAAPAAPPGYAPPPGYGYGYPPGYGYGYPAPYSYYPPGANLAPPLTLPYDEGQTVPNGYQIKSRAVRSLVVAGSVTFGSTYLVSLLTASTVLAGSPSDGKQLTPLFAPVVGPFIAVGTAHSSGAGTLLLVLDGLAQTGGAAMLIVGLAAEEKYLQRSAAARLPEVRVGPGSASLRWSF